MLFNLSAHTHTHSKLRRKHEAADTFLPEQTIRLRLRSVTRTKHVHSKGVFVSFDDEALWETQAAVVCLLSSPLRA